MVKASSHNGAYTADSITVTTDLKQIRRKPTGYIGTKDIPGQVHMIRELIDNSVDELILSPDGGDIDMLLMRDVIHDRYQMVVRDNGRGIPSGKLLEAVTILGASGKGETGAYTASGGQFGYGMKVASALSTRCRVISTNNTENVTGTVILNDGEVVSDYTELSGSKYGVVVAFEPDFVKNEDGQGKYFYDGPAFMNAGYLEVIKLCKQLNIFNTSLRFVFRIIDRVLPDQFWSASCNDALTIIDSAMDDPANEIAFDSHRVGDKAGYLFELWKCNSSILFTGTYSKAPHDATDRLGFDVKLYFSNRSATGNPQYFISVNNVALMDVLHNSATVGFVKTLRARVASRIDNESLIGFVRNEYKFNTMMLAIGIRYNLADHEGITKSSFVDSVFEKCFIHDLENIFDGLGVEYWDKLVNMILPDIEARFAQLHNTPVRSSDSKRAFMDLQRAKSYKECKTTGPECELYIVEGTSAGNIMASRDNVTQAIYTTRGKPINASTSRMQMDINRKALMNDPIYKDLMRITNITPSTTDVVGASRFGKIIIATDADPDGMHIAAIHLQNLYIINPRLIESGLVYVAQPPLYSMSIDRNNKLFLRDDTALIDARVRYLYEATLDVTVVSTTTDTQVHLTEGSSSYRDMAFLVNYVGDLMSIMANQLNIPLLILERLVLCIDYLYPKVNYQKLADYFALHHGHDDSVTVKVDEVGRYIVISVGHNDYTIGLDQLGESIYNNLLPFIMKYHIKDYLFIVKSKIRNAPLGEPTLMSMMTLYIAMCNLNKLCTIRRYKGIGELSQEDIFETVMNKHTRSMIHITSVGDIERNYHLLGSDTRARKQLLTDTGSLSSHFIKSTFRG